MSGDRFDAAYLEGVIDAAVAAPPPPTVRAAPAEPVALRGTVLTPDRVLDDGYVVIDLDGTIAAVQAAVPQGARVHATEGVILPGLIDLHGHPEFNVFAAWEPPKLFANRYRWRDSDELPQPHPRPQNTLLAELHAPDAGALRRDPRARRRRHGDPGREREVPAARRRRSCATSTCRSSASSARGR